MQAMSGCITVAQESRFRLVDTAGVSHLFLVSRDVALNPYVLQQLATDRTRVEVRFEASASMVAGIAHGIAIEHSNDRSPS